MDKLKEKNGQLRNAIITHKTILSARSLSVDPTLRLKWEVLWETREGALMRDMWTQEMYSERITFIRKATSKGFCHMAIWGPGGFEHIVYIPDQPELYDREITAEILRPLIKAGLKRCE